MATPRLLPILLLTFSVLASGCALPDAAPAGLPDGSALLVAWAPDRWAYVLDLPEGAALPEGLVLRVTETETGRSEDVPRDALSALGNGSHEARPSLRVEAGRTYVVEAIVGGQAALRREVRALDDDVQTPPGLDREVSYDATMRMTEDDDGERTTMDLAGAIRLAPAPEGRARVTMDVEGDMKMRNDEGMRMDLRATMHHVAIDDETVEALLMGEGDWEMEQEGSSGEGSVGIRQEHVGHEDKPDAEGVVHRAEKVATRMEMDGTIAAGGFPGSLRMVSEGHEWRRADTGDLIWRATNGTTTVTVGGTPHEETEREDEAVPFEEGEGDILDAFSWEGPRPWPLVPGDVFEQASEAGLRVRYRAEVTEPGQALGRDVPVLLIRGDATGEDASGTETWRLVTGHDLDGIIVSGTSDYARGDQTARMQMTLRPSA